MLFPLARSIYRLTRRFCMSKQARFQAEYCFLINLPTFFHRQIFTQLVDHWQVAEFFRLNRPNFQIVPRQTGSGLFAYRLISETVGGQKWLLPGGSAQPEERRPRKGLRHSHLRRDSVPPGGAVRIPPDATFNIARLLSQGPLSPRPRKNANSISNIQYLVLVGWLSLRPFPSQLVVTS